MAVNPAIRFIVVQWLDYLGTLRCRVLPRKQFHKIERLAISKGNLGTLQNDHITPVCDPVGQIMVEPDLASLRIMPGSRIENVATCMARFTDEDGEPLDLCPRSELQRLVAAFEKQHAVVFLIGFEIEVTFCHRNKANESDDSFRPFDTNHAWGTFTDEQFTHSFPWLTNIVEQLETMGIDIQQLHSEAGAGQYEFVLPPLPPVQAVDTLIQARQCIQQYAAQRNLRATYHPMPFPGIGTAAHAHISFASSTHDAAEVERVESCFMSAVLEHLPALCAFTMPQAVSYGRVVEDSWTGGVWVAWGTQNREVPLRKVDGPPGTRRWEVRCLDGCANMYLALASVFGVGLHGVKTNAEMKLGDCRDNPSKLSDSQRTELGIMKMLPTSIEDAVEALEMDAEVAGAMSEGMVKHYLTMKKAEQNMLNEMLEHERRIWLIERY